ncbi:DUF6452 family protein [Christiangramia aquimixticola]|uniref:DUF6452 family protein n=1 Tax=Christiangramia aquimixticola TaxID=1697558 RepID=UPI003AA9990F
MSCQRDDICPESTDTTPFLILRFYENVDPFDPVAPQNLSIKDPEIEGYVTIRSGQDETITYFRYSKDSLAIPLKTSADITTFEFTVNTDNIPEEGEETSQEQVENTDILTFTYGRNEEYINRACAYKMNFTGLKVSHDIGSDGAWIQDIEVEQVNIEDQNNAHVSIFF